MWDLSVGLEGNLYGSAAWLQAWLKRSCCAETRVCVHE
jgi:hypothetical protein